MATTFDKASLVMIPSGYKDDKLYSIKPTDGSGDFTFSRDGAGASPATRVNASGLIEKGRENTFTYSNTFNGADWTNERLTITSGQSGYDGSSNAWKLIPTTENNSHRINQATSLAGVKTFSVYLKANGYSKARILAFGGGNAIYEVDLSDGSTITTPNNTIDFGAESVGNGWYRVTLTGSLAHTNYYVFVLDGNGDVDFAGNGTDGILIQDAQLEQGLVATDYIETTTAAVSAGLLGDMPRLDYHNPDSPTPNSCPSLLLEPSRVNLLAHSEYLSGWNAFTPSSTIANNSAISPEGVQNACEITFTGSGNDFAYDNLFYSVTAPSVFSVYLRVASGTKLVALRTAIGNEYKAVTITTEWQRFELNITQTQASERIGIDNRAIYGGSGTAGTIEVYGAQLEAGSYPTSYIPTYGSASTRGRDDSSLTGVTDLIGQTEGTLYFEGTSNVIGGSTNLINFNHATNSVVINRQSNKTIRGIISISGPDITFTSSVIDGTFKAAIAYKDGDSAFYVNGVQVGTSSTSFSFGTALSEIYLGAGINYFALSNQSAAKQALVFKTRLTNAELAALTTI